MFLLYCAVALVVLGAWLRTADDDLLHACGLWLYGFGMVCAVVALSISCGSPTAPTSTYRLTFAKAPGCEPGEMPEPPLMEWDVSLRTGKDRMVFGWPNGLVVEFKSFGGHFMVCRIMSEA